MGIDSMAAKLVARVLAASLLLACTACGEAPAVMEAGLDGGAPARQDAATELDGGSTEDGGLRPDAPSCAGLDCSALDDVCAFGVCDPGAGVCVAAPRAGTIPCDDGDVCTADDRCGAGVCAGTAGEDGIACDDGEACTVADACSSGACTGAFVPGSSCASASEITLVDGLQRIEGTIISCSASRANGTCGGAGVESVQRLVLAAPRRVRIAAADGDATVLHLRDRCEEPATERACATGTGSHIETTLATGAHTLYVDSHAEVAGAFAVDVEVLEPNRCPEEPDLALPSFGETVFVRGDTRGDTNDFPQYGCNPSSSPDHVYRFVVTERTRLRFLAVEASYDAYLTVLAGGCDAPTAIACDDDSGGGRLPRIVHTFEPGEYHLVVEGVYSSNAGSYLVGIMRLTLD